LKISELSSVTEIQSIQPLTSYELPAKPFSFTSLHFKRNSGEFEKQHHSADGLAEGSQPLKPRKLI